MLLKLFFEAIGKQMKLYLSSVSPNFAGAFPFDDQLLIYEQLRFIFSGFTEQNLFKIY